MDNTNARPPVAAPRHVAYCDDHTRFTAGCRGCQRRNVAWNKRYRLDRQLGRPRLIPVQGTARRLRALACIGWPASALAERTGMSWQQIQHLQAERCPRITPAKAARVATMYEALSMTPGPSKRSRTSAAARGWVPPLAWDDALIDDPTASPAGAGPDRKSVRDEHLDEVAVHRAAAGDRTVTLTHTERAAAVEILSRKGMSDAEVADRLGMNRRSVTRVRAERGIPTGVAA